MKVTVNGVVVRNMPHRYGNSHDVWDHTAFLPPGKDDIPALTPAEVGTRLSDPRKDARLS